MKLIFAVVNGDDSPAVSKALSVNNYRATKIASSGGFLSSGSTTFLICVEDDQVDAVIDIVARKCHYRKEFISSAPSLGTPYTGQAPTIPVEVPVGGATVFVTNIERFEKL